MKRKKFIRKKLKEMKKLLKKYLPKKTYELEFEDMFNSLKELIV